MLKINASWVWDADNTRAHDFVVLRHRFTVVGRPERAVATVAAETKYWLWVNGRQAVFEGGLFRESVPGAGYADLVDLSPWLREGENILCALVWYYGNGGRNNKRLPQAGFLFDCPGLGISSGTNFRCLRHPAYYTTGEPRPGFLYGGDNIGFDGRKDIGDYWAVDFDDSGFNACTTYPADLYGGLVERPIPLLRVGPVQFGEAPCDGEGPSFALPHACAFTPYIEIDAAGGEVLDIRTDRYTINGGPGDDGQRYNAHRQEYICRPGRNVVDSPHYLYGEKLLVTVSGVTGGPAAASSSLRVGFRETGYDCDITGSFTCSDPLLNRLIEKSARTLYVCMRDNFMDCPDRERGQWIGDVSVQIPQVMFLLDGRARLLVKKCISDFIHLRDGDVLMGNVPGEHAGELAMQSLCALSEWGLIAQYYKYTGDKDALRLAFEPMVRYLKLWETDERELVKPKACSWRWFDHGYNADEPVLENAWFYSALRFAKTCAAILNDHRFDAFLHDRTAGIEASFHSTFLQKTNGLFYSSDGHADDRANALAVLAGLAPKETWPDLRRVLLSVFNSTVYMENFVLLALCEMGCVEDAYHRMRARYYNLAVNENSTLWEDFYILGTKNHAWSGAPATIAFRYFLGADTQDGGKTWTFTPHPDLFPDMRATFESQHERFRITVREDKLNVETDTTG